MQMHLSSDVQIPEGLLAANALLAENSRQGFGASTHTVYQGFGVAISSTAIGIPGTLYDGRVRCRYTGKERDGESGNDYFGARYYASTMGRFMSPDWSSNPISIPFARLDNPQTLNRYSYVNNNPLNHFDPYGHIDCPGGGGQDVVCAVQTAVNWIKNLFSGGGSGGGSSSGSGCTGTCVTPSPSDSLPRGYSTSRIISWQPTFRAPDYYNFNAQLGFANPSAQYVPSTHNWFLSGGLAAPKSWPPSASVTAGWSLSRRPEDYLGGKGIAGCGAFVVAGCVGYSPGGGGWAFEAGLGTPGYSLSASYAYDWNSYLQDTYQSLPVENPNGAVGIGSGLSYNPCADDFNCQF
jgi:RHS repeat-associated protein